MVSVNRLPCWLISRLRHLIGQWYARFMWRPESTFKKLVGHDASARWKLIVGSNESVVVENPDGLFKVLRLNYGQNLDDLVALTRHLRGNGFLLPDIVAYDNLSHVLVTTWVSGRPLAPRDMVEDPQMLLSVAKLHSSFHSVSLPSHLVKSIHRNYYLTELVIPRFLYWAEVRVARHRLSRYKAVAACVRRHATDLAGSDHWIACNPDFSLNNIVVTEDGPLALVDLEWLTADTNPGFELESFANKLDSLQLGLGSRYLDSYDAFSPVSQWRDERVFWRACVEMKSLGKMLKYYRIDDDYLDNKLLKIEDYLSELH